jgi:hypothetical protein
VERSFAHVCETGGARRTWLRGRDEVTKRYLITVAAHNLAQVLRKLIGVGKPRALQGSWALCALPSDASSIPRWLHTARLWLASRFPVSRLRLAG